MRANNTTGNSEIPGTRNFGRDDSPITKSFKFHHWLFYQSCAPESWLMLQIFSITSSCCSHHLKWSKSEWWGIGFTISKSNCQGMSILGDENVMTRLGSMVSMNMVAMLNLMWALALHHWIPQSSFLIDQVMPMTGTRYHEAAEPRCDRRCKCPHQGQHCHHFHGKPCCPIWSSSISFAKSLTFPDNWKKFLGNGEPIHPSFTGWAPFEMVDNRDWKWKILEHNQTSGAQDWESSDKFEGFCDGDCHLAKYPGPGISDCPGSVIGPHYWMFCVLCYIQQSEPE